MTVARLDRPVLGIHPIVDLYGPALLLVWAAGLAYLQRRRPWRSFHQSVWRRLRINGGLGALGMIVYRILVVTVSLGVAGWAEDHGVGLLHLVALPTWVEVALAVLLLDHQLYVWHWLNHRVGLLWRFHLVHHIDPDLSLATAARFHVGELALSSLHRAAAVVLIGAAPTAVLLYEVAFPLSVAFHHSNVKLPERLERALNLVIVTPRMHSIHHAADCPLASSNFSNLFTFWDRLHRTLRLDVSVEAITIGVPAYVRDAVILRWRDLITLPFRRQRDDWVGR